MNTAAFPCDFMAHKTNIRELFPDSEFAVLVPNQPPLMV